MPEEFETKGNQTDEVVPIDLGHVAKCNQKNNIDRGKQRKVGSHLDRNQISDALQDQQLRNNPMEPENRKTRQNAGDQWPKLYITQNGPDGVSEVFSVKRHQKIYRRYDHCD